MDLLFPRGGSVNDDISEKVSLLSYIGVEEAASGILARGKESLLAKADIQSAYQNIPIHPDDRDLLGMIWDGAL